ncbi:MAG: UbiA family prenyltransferase, partial [FCB group bacterium]|nr:UbiA family prenyltransferase [FCB group bacterium]
TVEKAKLIQYVSLGLGVVSLLAAGISSFILGALLYLFWGILYNLQPFHFKKKPVLGMLTNSLAGLILYFAGWLHVFLGESASFSDALSSRFILIAIPYLLCYTAVSLLTTIPDIKGDRETGANTFPIQFGRLTTIILATLFVLGALALGLKLGDPISSTAAIVSLPFYLVACFRQDSDDILRSIRYSLLILAVFVMTIYPLLFPAVFIVFYLSKYYYWHRFDLHYPTFVMDHDQN